MISNPRDNHPINPKARQIPLSGLFASCALQPTSEEPMTRYPTFAIKTDSATHTLSEKTYALGRASLWHYSASASWHNLRLAMAMQPELTLYGFPGAEVSREEAKVWRDKLESIEGCAQFVAAGAFLDCYSRGALQSISTRHGGSDCLSARAREASGLWIEGGAFIAAAAVREYRVRPNGYGGAHFNIGFGRRPFSRRLPRMQVMLDGQSLAAWSSEEGLQ